MTFGGMFWRRARAELLLAEGAWEEALEAADDMRVPWLDEPGSQPVAGPEGAGARRPGPDRRGGRAREEEVEAAREWGAPGAIGRAMRVIGTLRRDDGIDTCARPSWCSRARRRGSSG